MFRLHMNKDSDSIIINSGKLVISEYTFDHLKTPLTPFKVFAYLDGVNREDGNIIKDFINKNGEAIVVNLRPIILTDTSTITLYRFSPLQFLRAFRGTYNLEKALLDVTNGIEYLTDANFYNSVEHDLEKMNIADFVDKKLVANLSKDSLFEFNQKILATFRYDCFFREEILKGLELKKTEFLNLRGK